MASSRQNDAIYLWPHTYPPHDTSIFGLCSCIQVAFGTQSMCIDFRMGPTANVGKPAPLKSEWAPPTLFNGHCDLLVSTLKSVPTLLRQARKLLPRAQETNPTTCLHGVDGKTKMRIAVIFWMHKNPLQLYQTDTSLTGTSHKMW